MLGIAWATQHFSSASKKLIACAESSANLDAQLACSNPSCKNVSDVTNLSSITYVRIFFTGNKVLSLEQVKVTDF